MTFIFGLTVTALLLAILHWLPYPKQYHAVVNYTLGTAAIFIGLTIWRPDLLVVWAFPICGGLTVIVCYAIDRLLNMRVRASLNESEYKRVPETQSN